MKKDGNTHLACKFPLLPLTLSYGGDSCGRSCPGEMILPTGKKPREEPGLPQTAQTANEKPKPLFRHGEPEQENKAIHEKGNTLTSKQGCAVAS